MRARDVALVLTASWLTAQEPGAVFRATVDLVQVDAIVTGSNGRPVSDLHPGDFDLEQDVSDHLKTSISELPPE